VTRQIFDQDRPRSKMAQRLDEAFAGCDQWTLAPRPQRRGGIDVSHRAAASPRGTDPAVPVRIQMPGALR